MKLLLLAGTREARELSFALNGADLVSSLAGMTQRPAKLGGKIRVGGFGGVAGLSSFLRSQNIGAVIDATHPFAAQMSYNAHQACQLCQVPLLQVLRPAWDVRPGWSVVSDLTAAAKLLKLGSHVFLATGRGSLEQFSDRSDVEFTTRVIDETSDPFPLAKGRFLVSQPPFSIQEEIETLRQLGVSSIVARNSGGTGGIEKVIAAERLAVQVVMVERPVLPNASRVSSVEGAVSFMEANGWLVG